MGNYTLWKICPLHIQIRQNNHDLIIGSATSMIQQITSMIQQIQKLPWAWQGYLDEIRIWDIARTAAEIEENFSISLDGTLSMVYLLFEF